MDGDRVAGLRGRYRSHRRRIWLAGRRRAVPVTDLVTGGFTAVVGEGQVRRP
jgi:hypothetical protein